MGSRVLDLGTGDVLVENIDDIYIIDATDGVLYLTIKVRDSPDLMVFSNSDRDLVMRVTGALGDAIELGPNRIILTDLIRSVLAD